MTIEQVRQQINSIIRQNGRGSITAIKLRDILNGLVDNIGQGGGSSSGDGAQGPQGRDGKDGAPGLTGRDGTQGRQGRAGTDGSNGQQGRQGQSGTNGIDGLTGNQGRQGRAGVDAEGSQGPVGLQGPAGIGGGGSGEGESGSQGPVGVQGPAGAVGNDGDRGAQGPMGPAGGSGEGGSGAQGFQGESGAQGVQGTQGEKGEKGETGDGYDQDAISELLNRISNMEAMLDDLKNYATVSFVFKSLHPNPIQLHYTTKTYYSYNPNGETDEEKWYDGREFKEVSTGVNDPYETKTVFLTPDTGEIVINHSKIISFTNGTVSMKLKRGEKTNVTVLCPGFSIHYEEFIPFNEMTKEIYLENLRNDDDTRPGGFVGDGYQVSFVGVSDESVDATISDKYGNKWYEGYCSGGNSTLQYVYLKSPSSEINITSPNIRDIVGNPIGYRYRMAESYFVYEFGDTMPTSVHYIDEVPIYKPIAYAVNFSADGSGGRYNFSIVDGASISRERKIKIFRQLEDDDYIDWDGENILVTQGEVVSYEVLPFYSEGFNQTNYLNFSKSLIMPGYHKADTYILEEDHINGHIAIQAPKTDGEEPCEVEVVSDFSSDYFKDYSLQTATEGYWVNVSNTYRTPNRFNVIDRRGSANRLLLYKDGYRPYFSEIITPNTGEGCLIDMPVLQENSENSPYLDVRPLKIRVQYELRDFDDEYVYDGYKEYYGALYTKHNFDISGVRSKNSIIRIFVMSNSRFQITIEKNNGDTAGEMVVKTAERDYCKYTKYGFFCGVAEIEARSKMDISTTDEWPLGTIVVTNSDGIISTIVVRTPSYETIQK